MDLVAQVAANLGVAPEKAEKGIGAILTALRVGVDPETFAAVRRTLPNCDRLMGRSLMSGARTGEMAPLVGPPGLLAALAAVGYQKDDTPRLGQLVLGHLRPAVGTDTIEQLLGAAPALRG
jgi:hypothetical protein